MNRKNRDLFRSDMDSNYDLNSNQFFETLLMLRFPMILTILKTVVCVCKKLSTEAEFRAKFHNIDQD